MSDEQRVPELVMDPSALTLRLRELVGAGAGARHARSEREIATAEHSLGHVASLLGGQLCELDGGCCMVVDRWYAPQIAHGDRTIGVCADAMSRYGKHLAVLGVSRGGQQPLEQSTVQFFDLETTGLAGGAGTYAFLVGCGTFVDGSFHTRQFFLTSYGAERPLLGAVAQWMANATMLVSFNGRAFDAPVLETRYLFHRRAVPFSEMVHLDMLHVSRRLWGSDTGCSLRALEEALAGVVRTGDIPGAEIPARYLYYARTGDARLLREVFEHNRLDLLSLAVLASVAVRLVEEGAMGTRDARECLGLGWLFERVGLNDRAAACYAHAASNPAKSSPEIRVEALRRLARRMRRDGRHRDAADTWRQMLALGGGQHPALREAVHALAVHHEHRSRDLQAAHHFAMRAVVTAATETHRVQAHHRLARLNRKLGLFES